eukprot:3123732-Prymnesium_polylepis.1
MSKTIVRGRALALQVKVSRPYAPLDALSGGASRARRRASSCVVDTTSFYRRPLQNSSAQATQGLSNPRGRRRLLSIVGET